MKIYRNLKSCLNPNTNTSANGFERHAVIKETYKKDTIDQNRIVRL